MESDNRQITQTVLDADQIKIAPRFYVAQTGFILDEARFRILTGKDPSWSDWVTRFAFIFIGSFLTLFAKVAEKLLSQQTIALENAYKNWEVWFCVVSMLLYLFVKLIEKFNKSEKKKLILEIKEHIEINKKFTVVEK